MKTITKKRLLPILACIGLVTMATSQAAITISNFSFSGTTLTFDAAGSVDVVGTNLASRLYFGEVGNNAWIGGNATGTVTNNAPASSVPVGGALSYTQSNSVTFATGDFVEVFASRDLVVGDTIDISVEITNASFNASAIDTSNLIVTAGFNGTNPFPDASIATGGSTSIPEPSGLMLASLGGLSLIARRRRKA